MATRDASSAVTQVELGPHLRSLVDECLEEGQYEAAISLLDQLRAERYLPHAPFIRQLVCMALYPSTTVFDNSSHTDQDLLGSPRKILRQTKAPLLPSPRAAAMAQQLLTSYALTNSATSIFRALPGYHHDLSESPEDDADSIIADEALRIKQCAACWQLLDDDFQLRVQQRERDGRSRSRKHRNDIQPIESSPVSESAWPLLEWFIFLFEQDENGINDSYSACLLEQIPPSSDAKPRWDTKAPLNIVFYCLRQLHSAHRQLGMRLLRLLINLTVSPEFNSAMLVTNIFARLNRLSDNDLDEVWSRLGTTEVVLRFKIAICMKYLATDNSQPASRIRPQVRAQPRPSRVSDRPRESQQSIKSTASKPTAAPTASDVLHVLETRATSSTDVMYQWLKLELILAFDALHQISPEQGSLWSLQECLRRAFPEGDEVCKEYREVLECMTGIS